MGRWFAGDWPTPPFPEHRRGLSARRGKRPAQAPWRRRPARAAERITTSSLVGFVVLVLAKLWLRGYMRMMRVRIDTGPAMARYRAARADAEARPS